MPDQQFISYAQNGEDVVLWRALGHVKGGRYVDVGANDPTVDSVTKVFADAGWDGICVEPLPELAQRLREARPSARVFAGVAADQARERVVLHSVPGTGLSSLKDDVGAGSAEAGYEVVDLEVPATRLDDLVAERWPEGTDLHLVVIDVEGAEADVLKGFDLTRWRPWVLVVEATRPNSNRTTHEAWEESVLAAGYSYCLFDGLSRFYVADERRDHLATTLSYPACVLDDFLPARIRDQREEREELLRQVVHWRTTALGTWARAVEDSRQIAAQAEALREARKRVRKLYRRVQRLRGKAMAAESELERMRSSTSWRVTGPLRGAGGSARRLGRRGP